MKKEVFKQLQSFGYCLLNSNCRNKKNNIRINLFYIYSKILNRHWIQFPQSEKRIKQ